MRILKALAVAFLVMVAGLVLLAGYLGFVPVLSGVIGPNQPRDLGVAFSAEAALVAAKTMNLPVQVDDLEKIAKNPEAARTFNGELSAAEASSLLLLYQDQIDDFPIYLASFKFNPDNTAEASGIIRAGDVGAFLQNTGVSRGDAEVVINTLSLLRDAPFYLKGRCQISNNRVTLDVSQVEIGRLPVPNALYDSNRGAVESYVGNALSIGGLQVKTLSVENGKLKLEGSRQLSTLRPWLDAVYR